MHNNDANTVTLTRGDYIAVIDLQHGARCISIRNKKYCASLLREPPEDKEPDDPYTYGMPILFPVNRIDGGRFSFEGRDYIFPINEPSSGSHLHGTLHGTPFYGISVSASKLKCRYTATKNKPYLLFPHEFSIDMEYELDGSGLRHTVTITNNSPENMPVFLGFHTNFNTLFQKDSIPDNIRVSIDVTEEFARDGIKHLPTGEILPLDAVSEALVSGNYNPFSEKISRHYRGTGKMSVSDLGCRLRVVYENDEKYGFRMIYNGGDGYISLEPMSCLAGCQNSPFSRDEAGFDFLRAGEEKRYISRIYLEKF